MFKNFLFPQSRMKYVKKDHEKECKDCGCVFCNIAKDDPKTPTKKLYQDDTLMVVMNIYPYNVGHLQIVPLRHIVWFDEMTKKEQSAIVEMINRTVKLLKKVEDPVGMNIGLNMAGECAGASIMHLHVHVVPRYKRDFGFMEVTNSTRVLVEPIDETYKKLMKHVNILKGK